MKRKIKHPAVKGIILAGMAILLAVGGIYSHFGGFGTGNCADTEEFARYVVPVSDLTIPEQTQMVALGEATHGNQEFQQLKLDVFQILVEKYGVKAFALEGDYGGCEAVNRYIHGGEGNAQEAAASIGFAIYRTSEIEDLISWMKTYNESAKEGEDLCFYGFDMQRIAYNYQYLLEASEKAGIDTARLKEIWNEAGNTYADEVSSEQKSETLHQVKEALLQKTLSEDSPEVHYADILLQNLELGKVVNDTARLPALRDKLMAENAMWILKQEQKRGNQCIFLAGHNGHMEQFGSYSEEDKVMGNLLADELGDGYFAIGTDFYKSCCNLPKGSGGKRITHTFYSYDPLAKASKECGFDMSYLDFSIIPESSELKKQTTEYTWMGSVGEGYSFLYNLLPVTYRVWRSPAETFDSMIYVTEAHPTRIKEAK